MDTLIGVLFVVLLLTGNVSFLFKKDTEPKWIRWLSILSIFLLGLLLGLIGLSFPVGLVAGLVIGILMTLVWLSIRVARPY